MTHTQFITTAVAVSLALIVALGLLFFGPKIFTPFQPEQVQTDPSLTQSSTTPTMDTNTGNTQPAGGQAPLGTPASAPNMQKLPTELTMTDTLVGTGAEAKAGQQVTVNYVGMLPDGTVFDASSKHSETAKGFTFALGAGQVIKGWDMGVAGMKVGGKRRLIIPPSYGYGAQGAGNVIPPNATLIFDVELVAVK